MLQSVPDGRVVRKLRRKATPAERFRQALMDAVAGAQETFSGYWAGGPTSSAVP